MSLSFFSCHCHRTKIHQMAVRNGLSRRWGWLYINESGTHLIAAHNPVRYRLLGGPTTSAAVMKTPVTAPDGPNGQPAAMPPPSNITGGATQLPTRIKCAAKGPDPDPGALPPGLPKLTTSCLALSWANGEDIADSFKSKLKSNQTAPFKNEAQKRQTSTSINFKVTMMITTMHPFFSPATRRGASSAFLET